MGKEAGMMEVLGDKGLMEFTDELVKNAINSLGNSRRIERRKPGRGAINVIHASRNNTPPTTQAADLLPALKGETFGCKRLSLVF